MAAGTHVRTLHRQSPGRPVRQWKMEHAAGRSTVLSARLISTSEAKAWKQAFEVLLGEAIGQTDKANLNGGPSYAVPLVANPLTRYSRLMRRV
ncbi:MAG: hypothetical protein R3C59_29445 [Planctomycetaceae bacterium]